MATSKPKFTAADRKALALAAFLFYVERDYLVELNHFENGSSLQLTVFFSRKKVLEQCPLLDWPFISCDDRDLDEFDRVSKWTIPL